MQQRVCLGPAVGNLECITTHHTSITHIGQPCTVIGRVPRTGQNIVGGQLQVQILLTQETIHERDELQDQLILS